MRPAGAKRAKTPGCGPWPPIWSPYLPSVRAATARWARELLGGTTPPPSWASDRHKAYGYLPVLQRQACWSHLERTFEKFVDRGGDAGLGRPAAAGVHAPDVLLVASRSATARWSDPACRPTSATCDCGFRLRAVARRAVGRREDRQDLPPTWPPSNRPCGPSSRKEGVEPTNNAAERALRHGVLWRKGSFGTHSPAGSRLRRAHTHRARHAAPTATATYSTYLTGGLSGYSAPPARSFALAAVRVHAAHRSTTPPDPAPNTPVTQGRERLPRQRWHARPGPCGCSGWRLAT